MHGAFTSTGGRATLWAVVWSIRSFFVGGCALAPAAALAAILCGAAGCAVRQPRHFIGAQLGGSTPIGFAYRYRLVDPALLDSSAALAFSGLAAAVGFLVEPRDFPCCVPYAGAGVGYLSADRVGYTSDSFYGYWRIGSAFKLGERGVHRIGLDVGAWYGTAFRNVGWSRFEEVRRFLWPMAGASYLYGFD